MGEEVAALSLEVVRRLVAAELERDDTRHARPGLDSLLVSPTPLRLTWQFGDEPPFDAWLVGRSPDGRIGLVYCTHGLGESFPWGAILLADLDQGVDSQWHSGLVDAAISFELVSARAGYEVPGPRD